MYLLDNFDIRTNISDGLTRYYRRRILIGSLSSQLIGRSASVYLGTCLPTVELNMYTYDVFDDTTY